MSTCKWSEDSDGNWDTECEEMFIFNDGTPSENKCRFCPYCGKNIEEIRYIDPDEQ